MKKIDQQKLDEIVKKITSKNDIFGATFYVQSKDKTINLKSSSGNLSIDSNYYIASINKLFISFIVLRSHQIGEINLEDKISNYLPAYLLSGLGVIDEKDYSQSITIKHLLSHTSGIPCYLIDKMPDGTINMDLLLKGNDQSWPLEKVVAEVKGMKMKFVPDSRNRASYSETNFRLLGKIMEQIKRKSIREILQDVFNELELTNTFVIQKNTVRDCTPIFFKQNQINIQDYWQSTQHDIASTSSDQMKFIRAFFEGNYLENDLVEKLKKWNKIFFPFQYGVGVQKISIPRIFSPFKAIPEMLGHCGSIGSVAFYIPEKKVFITGTINQSSCPNVAIQSLFKMVNAL